MINELLLLSANDIPFPQAQLNVHQPTIKELGYLGEKNFYSACGILKFTKDSLPSEDKNSLKDFSNFDIIMSTIKDKTVEAKKNRLNVLMLLTLLFPQYDISFGEREIICAKDEEVKKITNDNFDAFKEIIQEIFCLSQISEKEFDTSGAIASKIADKIRKGRKKVADAKSGKSNTESSVLSRYISILSVGEQKDMNILLNYTVYQLFDEFTRFELKQNYDVYLSAKLAGAKDMKEVDNWMKDIHTIDNNNDKK